VKSLIISDLHLGSRLGHSVLLHPRPLERLLVALDDIDRLVLLGDTIELLEGRPEQAIMIAEPIVRAIGARLGANREVLLIPGNHDAALVRAWVRARGYSLALENMIGNDTSPTLERLTSWLAPARVEVRYPGAWLSEGVWATHGHYLDYHLFPVSAYGILRGSLGRVARTAASPNDFEHARRPSLTRTSRWLPRPVMALLDDVAELIRASTMPRLHRTLLKPRIAPLTARLLGTQMQRASIPALARVLRQIGVDSDWVVFGHVHRLGPLRGDELEQWRGPGGRPRFLNSGSWLYEPALVHRARPPHPYWPGGAVLLEPGADPRAIGLLDELSDGDLH